MAVGDLAFYYTLYLWAMQGLWCCGIIWSPSDVHLFSYGFGMAGLVIGLCVPPCLWRHKLVCFCEILAQNYAPEAAAPGANIIWSNVLSQICSISIIPMDIAPGTYICYMLLEHCAFKYSWNIFAICSLSFLHSACSDVLLLAIGTTNSMLRGFPRTNHNFGADFFLTFLITSHKKKI